MQSSALTYLARPIELTLYQAWWCVTLIPVLRRLKLNCAFKFNLGYEASPHHKTKQRFITRLWVQFLAEQEQYK